MNWRETKSLITFDILIVVFQVIILAFLQSGLCAEFKSLVTERLKEVEEFRNFL